MKMRKAMMTRSLMIVVVVVIMIIITKEDTGRENVVVGIIMVMRT